VKYLKVLLFIVFTIVIGVAIAIYRIADVENSKAFFHNGNWMGSNKLPLGKDNLITAQVSVFALFALPSKEAVYVAALRDNNQQIFNAKNDYVINGNIKNIKAPYWSITAYGKDLFLIDNKAARYSFNNTTLKTDTNGNYTIIISAKEQSGNWLPTPNNDRFGLLLRIYLGDKKFLSQLETAPLPEIKKVMP
jgi:hypothetical protein